MAKKSMINRDLKRRKVVEKYMDRRKALLEIIGNFKVPDEEKMLAREKLQRLPRNASPVRLRSRCALTGRPRGVFKKFGLARGKLREIAMRGEVPGIIKASW